MSRYRASPSTNVRVWETSIPWGSDVCDLIGSSSFFKSAVNQECWDFTFRGVTLGSEMNSLLCIFLVVSDDMTLFIMPMKWNPGSGSQMERWVTVRVSVQIKWNRLGFIRLNASYGGHLKSEIWIVAWVSKCCPSSLPSLKLDKMNPTHKHSKSRIATQESNKREEPFTSEGM